MGGGYSKEVSATLLGMDMAEKQAHADRLRRAIAEKGIDQVTVADRVGRGRRTVTNWTSRTKPTMPNDRERAILRDLLGDYDQVGDPVEIAVRRSSLVEWRQDAVVSFYKRNLHEQSEGVTA